MYFVHPSHNKVWTVQGHLPYGLFVSKGLCTKLIPQFLIDCNDSKCACLWLKVQTSSVYFSCDPDLHIYFAIVSAKNYKTTTTNKQTEKQQEKAISISKYKLNSCQCKHDFLNGITSQREFSFLKGSWTRIIYENPESSLKLLIIHLNTNEMNAFGHGVRLKVLSSICWRLLFTVGKEQAQKPKIQLDLMVGFEKSKI